MTMPESDLPKSKCTCQHVHISDWEHQWVTEKDCSRHGIKKMKFVKVEPTDDFDW